MLQSSYYLKYPIQEKKNETVKEEYTHLMGLNINTFRECCMFCFFNYIYIYILCAYIYILIIFLLYILYILDFVYNPLLLCIKYSI